MFLVRNEWQGSLVWFGLGLIWEFWHVGSCAHCLGFGFSGRRFFFKFVLLGAVLVQGRRFEIRSCERTRGWILSLLLVHCPMVICVCAHCST